MPDNPNEFQPTRYGQPYKPTGIGATLFPQGTDPYLQQIPTRSGLQQAAQMATLPLALSRLLTGFRAPSIEPAAAEARRQFRENVVPDLMEQFAGGGSQGALLRGIQGAGSDLQSKLAALQYEKQSELQKLQQQQLPQLLESALTPSFQPHITNMPLHGSPKTLTTQISESENLAKAGRIAKGLGNEVTQKGKEKLNFLSDKFISNLEKYSPNLATKLKNISLSTQNALKGVKEKGEHYAKPWSNPSLPPVPVNADKNQSQAEKKLTPPAKQGLDDSLLPFMNSDRTNRLNKVFTKRQRGEGRGYNFFDSLKYIKTPDQLDRWLDILLSGVRTDKTRQKNLDKFLAEMGAGNA